jgi:hypothetical protein
MRAQALRGGGTLDDLGYSTATDWGFRGRSTSQPRATAASRRATGAAQRRAAAAAASW